MNKSDAVNQRIVSRLVEREVHYCVSGVVARLMELEPDNEELHDLMQSRDYETPLEDVTDEKWEEAARDADYQWEGDHKRKLITALGAEECCERLGLEPDYIDIYEHWIVSDWAADKLSALGEVVVKDLYGLTVWGRCTTGQSISMDGIWWKIAEGMEILSGQANSWEDKA